MTAVRTSPGAGDGSGATATAVAPLPGTAVAAVPAAPRRRGRLVAVVLLLLLLGAALLTIVASFTRSYREAQSWLAAVLLVPTLPIIFASLYQVPSRIALMWVPSLSQHLLIQSLLKGEPLAPLRQRRLQNQGAEPVHDR